MSITLPPSIPSGKAGQYSALQESALALFAGERDAIANAANLGALLWQLLPDLNWAGFYFWTGEELVLGPFQGKVACIRIGLGRGVCGRAALERTTQIVPDVHQFPGHIACDIASRSEIVIPLVHDDRLLGVLDLDSPRLSRFDSQDAAGLEALARIWIDASDHGPRRDARMDDRRLFHLSLPVNDLAGAKRFYIEALGAAVGRENDEWLDILLWGHQITLHACPDQVRAPAEQGIRHFGTVLPWGEWERTIAKLEQAGIPFLAKPAVLLRGTAQEQGKFYLEDPGHNVIEIKAYRDVAGTLRTGDR